MRPHHFHPNPETAAEQRLPRLLRRFRQELARRATPSDRAAAQLRQTGVRDATCLTTDPHGSMGQPATPDSVFPNNWFSTHAGGHVALYPCTRPAAAASGAATSSSCSRQQYRVQEVVDYSGLEADNVSSKALAPWCWNHVAAWPTAQSHRANPVALERFCTHFQYEPMVFATADATGQPCYHTNVMLCIGTEFAMGGFHMVSDPQRHGEVQERLWESGRNLIELGPEQITNFAANALELQNPQWARAGPVGPRGCVPHPHSAGRFGNTPPLLPWRCPPLNWQAGRCAACSRASTWHPVPARAGNKASKPAPQARISFKLAPSA